MKIPILALLFLQLTAQGVVVTTFLDEDDGSLGGGAGISLREAVEHSSSGEFITFAPALSGQTIRLSLGRLQIFKSLTIDASALPAGLILSADRTGNGKTSDDTYAILLTGGDLLLDSLVLAGANCGESSGCITVRPSASFNLTLDHCTLTGNAGYHASALYCHGYQSRPTDAITIRNSTICTGNTPANIYISPNLTLSGANNILTGNPLLAPLGDYGGPTRTMPPLPGSPAIDAGGPTTLATDQRGFPRLSTPDIGAAEYQGIGDLTRFWKLDFDGDASVYGVEQALGTDPLVADPAHTRNLTAPAINESGHAYLSFGLNAASASGTVWTLKRSLDLTPGSFQEIYRYNGTADTAAPGASFIRTATGITVVDG